MYNRKIGNVLENLGKEKKVAEKPFFSPISLKEVNFLFFKKY